MKAIDIEKTEILESREALSFYLETLFREQSVPEIEEKETETKTKPIELTEIDLLFFSIEGHKLAVPVKDLKGVVEIKTDSLLQLPEMKPYTIGYYQYQGKNIAVNNIYWALNSDGSLQPPNNHLDISNINHIIIFNDERSSIACDDVSSITTVKKEKIKWRKSKPNQRWFKGIHTEDMSVILSTSEIKRLFLRGYKSDG